MAVRRQGEEVPLQGAAVVGVEAPADPAVVVAAAVAMVVAAVVATVVVAAAVGVEAVGLAVAAADEAAAVVEAAVVVVAVAVAAVAVAAVAVAAVVEAAVVVVAAACLVDILHRHIQDVRDHLISDMWQVSLTSGSWEPELHFELSRNTEGHSFTERPVHPSFGWVQNMGGKKGLPKP